MQPLSRRDDRRSRQQCEAQGKSTVAAVVNVVELGAEGRDDVFFETDAVPPPVGSQDSHTESWDAIRDSGISPLNVSTLDCTPSFREEFIAGAKLLGLGRKRMPELVPQMLTVADAVNANPRFLGLLLPRRSSKTTSLFALAMGRVSTREDYLVGYTMATTATKARQRFRNDVAAPLEIMFPDKKTRPFVINYAGGSESIRWNNGSIFQFLAPKGEAFRSDAWDLIIIDEAGEAEPELTEDLISGALATMDTRPDSTLIAAGTAGLFRDGNLLWDMLEDGRVGKNRTGIVEYAAPPTTSLRDIDDWESAKTLVLAAHPGIGTLTDLETIESNFEKLRPEQFLREYLSIFAKLGGSSFIDFGAWSAMGTSDPLPAPPKHFRLAFKVHPLQTSASIVAVWRDAQRVVHIGVLDHRKGVAWLHERLLGLSRKYGLPIVYDSGNNVDTVVTERLERARPRPKFEPQAWNAVSTAAATLLQEIDGGNVAHYAQPELDEAVRLAVKRGTKDSKRWAFGRGPVETSDITALEAASLALRAYDEAKPRVPIAIVTA